MNNPIPQLDPIALPKTKLTLLITGGGMMGLDVRKPIVSKGWLPTQRGALLCYSEPRGRKIFSILPILQAGAIVLRGHEEARPVFEGHARAEGGFREFIADGVGGRFIDYDQEGADALIDYLKLHMVFHTLGERHTLTLLTEQTVVRPGQKFGRREIADPDFKSKLLAGLGPALELEPAAPKEPERKELLTPKMKADLQAANYDPPFRPRFKIFSPEGSATWLLCSMESDGDTIWAVVDLGEGCVEYGHVSLRDLETRRGPQFKMPLERDKYFDGSKMNIEELLDKTSLMSR